MVGRTSVEDVKLFSVRKTGDTLPTYVFDVFQIFDISHLSLDKLEDNAVQNKRSTLAFSPNRGKEHIRLALRHLFRNSTPHFLGHQTMPLELFCRPPTHGHLESLQLSDALKVPHGLGCLLQKIDIGVPLRSFCPDSVKDDGVLLQVLRRTVEPMLQVHLRHIVRMSYALL